jgi:hypothetical protein
VSPSDASIRARLTRAAGQVAECAEAPVEEAKRKFADAFRAVVGVRNDLIAAPGETPSAPAADLLPKLNALLSLMTSIEFPLGGFHRERFGSTVRTIRQLADGA